MVHSSGLSEQEYRPKFPDSPFIHVADLVDRSTGKTYRELNAEKQHNIPIGALVEINEGESRGVRLFVVQHNRDCDMTPLYSLAVDPENTELEDDLVFNRGWHNGYPEDMLTVIEEAPKHE